MSLRRWTTPRDTSRRGHKYGAVRTEVDGITFASKAEAARYQELKLLERAQEIKELRLQPEFPLYAGCELPLTPDRDPLQLGVYRGDFTYIDCRTGRSVVEDVKGFKTPLYRWKKKHVEAQYGIQISEIGGSTRSRRRADRQVAKKVSPHRKGSRR